MRIWIVTDGSDGGLAVCDSRGQAEELLANVGAIPYSKLGDDYYHIVEAETGEWLEEFEG